MIHYDTHSLLPTRYIVELRGPFVLSFGQKTERTYSITFCLLCAFNFHMSGTVENLYF